MDQTLFGAVLAPATTNPPSARHFVAIHRHGQTVSAFPRGPAVRDLT
jgi:hypothetical protein